MSQVIDINKYKDDNKLQLRNLTSDELIEMLSEDKMKSGNERLENDIRK